MNEIWKDIEGYEGLYQVSNKGRIRRLKFINRMVEKDKITYLKLNKNTWGYLGAFLCKNGESKRFAVHRLVAKAFIPNEKEKPEVNHKDGNKENNCVENLEWCTRSENMFHSFANGLEQPPMKGKYGKLNVRSKPVMQYDLEGNFLREFESAGEASRYLNKKSADRSISRCCLGKRKTAYGYKWRHKK